MFKFIKKYLPTLSIIAGITLLSVLNFNDVPVKPKLPGFDKLVHFGMYTVCSYIFMLDLARRNRKDKYHLLIYALIAFAGAVVTGGVLEIVQDCFIPGRVGDWWDFAANSAGALTGVCAGYLFLKTVYPHVKKRMIK